jgi:hypothetical protein
VITLRYNPPVLGAKVDKYRAILGYLVTYLTKKSLFSLLHFKGGGATLFSAKSFARP